MNGLLPFFALLRNCGPNGSLNFLSGPGAEGRGQGIRGAEIHIYGICFWVGMNQENDLQAK